MKKKSTLRLVRSNPANGYGMKPWDPSQIRHTSIHDNWMIQQASSILGFNASLDQAKMLATSMNLSTRKPIEAEASKAPSAHWLSRALRAVFGGE